MNEFVTNLGPGRPDPIDTVRRLAAQWRATAVERDQAGGSATAELEQLRASHLLSLSIPTAYGGWGADWPTTLEVIREVATVDGSLGHLFGYHIGCVPMIELLGSVAQKERLYRQIAEHDLRVGNASSENNSHVLDWKVAATSSEDGGFVLNGTKHFCSGAKGSDLLLVFGVIQDESPLKGSIITAIIPTDRQGVQINDDWRAIGMRQTDSGSTEFRDVRVYPDEVLGAPNSVVEAFATSNRGSLWTPAIQTIFSTVYLGVARGALETATEYTRTQSRPWTPAGVSKVTEDPHIIATYGELAIELQGAEAAAREVARLLQKSWDRGDAVTPEERGELMVKVSGVKTLSTRAALDITSRVFETTGSRSTHPKYGFDRFWRNIRTHTLHDPVSYKIVDVGNYTLNGQFPVPGFTS